MNSEVQEKYLSKKQVRELVGMVGNTTICDWIKYRHFPKPLRLSQNMPVWRRTEVIQWVESYDDNNKENKNGN